MNRNGSSLAPARDLAQQREGQAAGRLAEKQCLADQQATRLELLRRYLREYTDGMSGEQRMGATKLRLYRTFLARLNEAVISQQEAVEQARREVESAREAWSGARSEVLALEKLITRRHEETRRRADKREQASIDELVVLRYHAVAALSSGNVD